MSWVFEGTLLPWGDTGQVTVSAAGVEAASLDPLPGAFALLGLVDGHCHLTLDRDEGWPFLDIDGAQARLEQLARTGVTVVRDVGGERTITLKLAQTISRGVPRVLAAGRFLAPAKRFFPGLFVPVEADDLIGAIAAEVRDGQDRRRLPTPRG